MKRDRALADYRRLIVAIAFNAPIILAILLRNARALDFNALTWVYLITVCLGYYVLAIWFVATVVFLALLPVRKAGIALSVAVIGAFTFYFLIDSFVFNLTRMHIDPFWMKWVVADFGAFGLSNTTLGSVLAVLLVVAALEYGLFRVTKRMRIGRILALSIFGALVAGFIISQAIHAIAYENNYGRVTNVTPYLPIYYPVSAHRQAAKYGGLLPTGEEDSVDVPGDDNSPLVYPLREPAIDTSTGKPFPNILVLFFESWRYDMMNADVTPNTYALSKKSLVCSNHFCSGNSTVAGIFGFFYGIHPTYWTAVKADNSRVHNPVLIDILQEEGYEFGIFAKSNFKRHKIKDAVFRGIDVRETFAGESAVGQDQDMTRQLIDFLRERQHNDKPFFAFAFYKANHAPYRYPPTDTLFRPAGDQNLMSADEETDPTAYLNDYRNATHFVDGMIGQVLREVDSLALMSNTIIIVSTDHGEEFNDDRSNSWGHGTNFTRYQTEVPLVIYAPGKEPRVITQKTSHVDVVPTLLQEFLHCTNDPRDYSNGANLYRTLETDRPMVAGSYVNHAFIIKDCVYEVYSLYTKQYKTDNIKAEGLPPDPAYLKRLSEEVRCFYGSK